MIGSRVFIVKERYEWSNFAELVGAMVVLFSTLNDALFFTLNGAIPA